MAAPAKTNARAYTSADWNDLYHTGPDTLAGRYMRLFWQPICRAEDLPVGKPRPIRIMGEDFTLYRGESGQPHLVGFRCAHRRTQLSIGWVEGDNIRCRYHGWAYDASGQCIEQPPEPEPFCQKVRVPGYPTEEYLGLIFAYLGQGDPPPLPRYPDFEEPGVREVTTYVRGCNYFNSIDNDPVHVYFVHRSPQRDWRQWNGRIPLISAEEMDYGVISYESIGGTRREGVARGMPNISFRLAAREYSYVHGSPPTDNLAWRVPLDDDTHISFNVALVHVSGEEEQRYLERRAREREQGIGPELEAKMIEEILAGQADLDEVDLPTEALITLQDHVTQQGQGSLPDHENEHLGRSDSGVILRRRIMARELRALAEGRPLKQWLPPSRAVGLVRDRESPR